MVQQTEQSTPSLAVGPIRSEAHLRLSEPDSNQQQAFCIQLGQKEIKEYLTQPLFAIIIIFKNLHPHILLRCTVLVVLIIGPIIIVHESRQSAIFILHLYLNILLFQVHCLQFLIYEVVSGGNMRKPGGLFGNSGSEIPVNDLKQLETFFYKLGFFLHVLDYTGSSDRLFLLFYSLLLMMILGIKFCIQLHLFMCIYVF